MLLKDTKSTCSYLPSGGCGSFYAIVIASSHFNGKPTVSAHRLVNEALKEVIAGIHGLQVSNVEHDIGVSDIDLDSHVSHTVEDNASKELNTKKEIHRKRTFLLYFY